MKRFSLAIAACIVLSIMSLPSWAEPTAGLKINPYAVDYPLTRSVPYRSTIGDPYEGSFGIRRWLRPLRMTQDLMHSQTLDDTQAWFSHYGSYGVLGHGEDVFTRQGERFRRMYRGH
jgi:hypothetical protein